MALPHDDPVAARDQAVNARVAGEMLDRFATPDAPPALASNTDGRLELFVQADDGTLWHRWQTAPNNDWSSQWESFGKLDDQRAMAWLVLTLGSTITTSL